ncbi:MAG: hypothetical protein RIT81_31570 [Deltaproteobacteria bacterium]
MKRTWTALTAVGLLLGCSGGERSTTPPPDAPASPVIVDETAPASASFSISASIPADGDIDTLGRTQAGTPIVAAQDRVYELVAGALEWRPLYVDGDEVSLSDVTVVAPRLAGGAWIAAGGRLFVLDGLYVLATPLALDAGAIYAIDEVATGPLAGLWIATEGGLYRRTDENLETWAFPDVTTVTDVAIEPNGRFGLVVADDTYATLEMEDGEVVTDGGAVELGAVRQVVASADAVWAAGAEGLLRFAVDDPKPYRHYTLGADADLVAIAADPVTGTPWVRTGTQLMEVDGPTIRAYAMASSTVDHIVVDNLGHVYVAEGDTLKRNGDMPSESATSFERDVIPWIQANCSQCHSNQTQDFETYEVFSEIAEDALSRVRRGDMPRCTGGVLCSPEQRLTAEQYAVIEQWLRDGKGQ